ncbi:MAG TPA: HAMP domain-containing histidine kinase [Actinobacteria bacterium]|nr:HAMP domain-containing histidine kinase [Actinomycetota bacterium]
MSVRTRAALYGTAVTAAAVVVFSLLLLALVRGTAPEEQERRLTTILDDVVAGLAAAEADRLVPTTPPILVDPTESSEPFVVVFDVDGSVRYTTGRLTEPAPLHDLAVRVAEQGGWATTHLDGTEVGLVAARWRNPGGARGVAVVAQPTAAIAGDVVGIMVFLGISGTVTLLLAAVAGWLVAGRALRPLRELVATTDEIGATGDLGRRLPPNPSRDEVGRLTRSFNTMLDRLEASQRELAAALDAQRRFVADASHELRSPLTTIRSNAGFLAERPDVAPDDRAEAIADIQAEADRMSALVDDLLALARGEAGRLGPRAPVDVAALAAAEARRLGVPVAVEAEGTPRVVGDEEALGRVLRILVDNAAKHGAPPIRVTIRNRPGWVVVAVTDAGPGFPPEALGRVFDRFYRADPARSGPGTGLGLAIARALVAAHGGTISAANDPAGGAVVTIDLPAAGSATAPEPT